jgi:hypothetical protein
MKMVVLLLVAIGVATMWHTMLKPNVNLELHAQPPNGSGLGTNDERSTELSPMPRETRAAAELLSKMNPAHEIPPPLDLDNLRGNGGAVLEPPFPLMIVSDGEPSHEQGLLVVAEDVRGGLQNEELADTLMVVSTFNNMKNTVQFIDSLKGANDQFDLLIVLDGQSADGSADVLRRMGVRVVSLDDKVSGLARSWNLGYSIFKKGHQLGQYKNMIIVNMRASSIFRPALLAGPSGMDMMRAALLRHPFVVPMRSNIKAIHQLDEAGSAYASDRGNYKRVQVGLLARAAEQGLSFTAANFANSFDGFFFAFRAPDIFKAEHSPDVLFNTVSWGHGADLYKRLAPLRIAPMISNEVFVFHHKYRLQEASVVDLANNMVAERTTLNLAPSVVVGLVKSDAQRAAAVYDLIFSTLGWTVQILEESEWYDLSGIDVLITEVPGYDLAQVTNEKPSLVKIAWPSDEMGGAGMLMTWAEERGFGLYDLFLSISEEEKAILEKQQPFGSVCTFRCPPRLGGELVTRKWERPKLTAAEQNAIDREEEARIQRETGARWRKNRQAKVQGKWARTRALLADPSCQDRSSSCANYVAYIADFCESDLENRACESTCYNCPTPEPIEGGLVFFDERNVPIEVVRKPSPQFRQSTLAQQLYEAMEKHKLVPTHGRVDFATKEMQVHRAPCRICAMMKTHPGQADLLENPLLSLIEQKHLRTNDDISMRVFLMNSDSVAYSETQYMTDAATHVNSIAGYEAVFVMEASSIPPWPHAYGYDVADTMLDHLLDTSDCTHFLVTNGHSVYTRNWLDNISESIIAGKQMIAWDFTVYYHDHRNSSVISTRFERDFVDSGAVLVHRRSIERAGVHFFQSGPFTDDFLARGWWFLKGIYDLVGEESVAIVHQVHSNLDCVSRQSVKRFSTKSTKQYASWKGEQYYDALACYDTFLT